MQNGSLRRVSQPASSALDGATWHVVRVGDVVADHAWLRTGRTGRLLLRRGSDVIQIKPNTVVAIAPRGIR